MGVLVLVGTLMLVAGQSATGADDAMARGDAAYARFDNDAALEHYLQAVETQPDDASAHWKVARALADVGAAIEEADSDRARGLYERSVTAARRAVALAPESADTHFILALAVGRLALFEGPRTRIELSREVKREADRAIELDPGHDGAHFILGRWHYEIATLGWFQKAMAKVIYGGVPPGASVERAADLFARAIDLDATRPGYHLEYARALIKLDRDAEARQQLNLCIELPQVYWEDPAYKAEAAEMLDDSLR